MPPIIVESGASNDMVVREGSNVTLVCKAKGYPEPYVSSPMCVFFLIIIAERYEKQPFFQR